MTECKVGQLYYYKDSYGVDKTFLIALINRIDKDEIIHYTVYEKGHSPRSWKDFQLPYWWNKV